MSGLMLQLKQYRLTTAEILYHMPDHPSLLQSYLWQEYDLAPQFPTLRKFLDFWTHNLDGKLHSVKVSSVDLLQGSSIDYVDTLMGAGFTVNNPNAVAACGCGSSFRTADDSGQARACAH